MQLITSLAVLATAASTVQAVGTAYIHNMCSYDVYLWPTDANRAPTSPTVLKAGSSYSEGYHTPTAGGVSIKISKTNQCTEGFITQLEYTLAGFGGNNYLWFDGSNVDCTATGCPFQADGAYLTTSKGASCPQCSCPPSTSTTAKCSCFYQYDVDNVNSFSCDQSADTMLYLCTDSATGGSSSSSSSSSSSPAAVPYSSPAAAAVVAPVAAKAVTAAPVSTTPVQMNEAVVTFTTVVYAKREAHGHAHAHARRLSPDQF